MNRAPIYLFALLLVAGLRANEPAAIDRLAQSLTGTFRNADQARGDQNFRSAVLHSAQMWPARTDGPWLYVEQALADAPDHPYRQMVYLLRQKTDRILAITVFDLRDPIGATGGWRDASRLTKLTPEQLSERKGCDILLEVQADGTFKGATEGTGCVSTLLGAAYSTMQMWVSPVQIITWERGYNAVGVQVWGSIHGGYEFKRGE
jgi:hypothetical protein